MFDDVSGRYDLLNRVMTLGQDTAWREAMWRRVPTTARAVLDLCTGSGVSLPGLRRAGRTVIGIDVSLAMLQVAARTHAEGGWSPRLACADGFKLPLRDHALDAVTVAFGIRNLRPRRAALAEIARVLVPGGRLVVLEAAAPAPGPLAPFARWWIRHAIPFAGRLSPDPTAYRYLSESIFEFGSGPEFEADLAAAGFRKLEGRSFLFGASRLWVAESLPAVGQKATEGAATLQGATPAPGQVTHPAAGAFAELDAARGWLLVRSCVSVALAAAMALALAMWVKVHDRLPLSPPQQGVAWLMLVGGLVIFGGRGVLQLLRWSASGGGGASNR